MNLENIWKENKIMAHLIDKDAVLAIIGKDLSYYKDLEDREIISDCGIACYRVVKMLKSNIDSLEVKEVDLEKTLNGFQNFYAHENSGEFPSAIEIAKHFFELGLKASQPTTPVYGIEEAIKENGIDPDSKEADMYREAVYKIYDRLKVQKG